MDFSSLQDKYSLLKDLMDHVPDVIYFKDRTGRLIMVNRSHAKGLGLKPEEVVGKTDFDIFPKDRAKKMTEDDLQVITTGKPIIDKIERATRVDGIDNYVSTTKIPRYNKKGQIIGLIGITRDITPRMQLKSTEEEKQRLQEKLAALEELNKLKSEFVSTVSHELRTPLSVVKEIVGVVSDGLAGKTTPKQKELFAKASNQIYRLQHIIEELLDISRIETGRMKLHYSLVNLNELIKDSSLWFKKLAQEKGINLEYRFAKKEIGIFVDAEKIIRATNNLIDNALKFTERGGRIVIESRPLENKVRVMVADSGIGIHKRDLPRLFNKFIQVSHIAGAEKKGIGLGLAIIKGIIEKHGGEIWAESKLGVGSKFYFTLPRFAVVDTLHKNMHAKINALLGEGKAIYLIHLFFVNYAEFKQAIKINPQKVKADLKALIEDVFNKLLTHQRDIFRMAELDIKGREYNIIFPEASEAKADQACALLKARIDNYFKDNHIENIFVNVSYYPYYAQGTASAEIANFHVKKIHIALNKRRFKRYFYQGKLEISYPNSEVDSVETLDISQGGICFLTDRQLKTDEQVKARMVIPKHPHPLEARGKVAWIKPEQELTGKIIRYKVGMEFVRMKKQEKALLKRLLRSLAVQTGENKIG